MAELVQIRKPVAVDPLKSSAPLGAALAYLGLRDAVPLLHGSQGCASFALTLAVRHFNEDMPMQTTGIDEIAMVLGTTEQLRQALVNIAKRMRPRLIGVASTALVETRGEDLRGDLALSLAQAPALAGVSVVLASTPDYEGALEDGWARAVTAIIETLVLPGERRQALPLRQLNVLPGVHLSVGDLEHLRELIAAFGLMPVFLPDLSGSLDGHIEEQYSPLTRGGTDLGDVAEMGRALHTLAIGEHMRPALEALEGLTGVPGTLLPSLLGLTAVDQLVALLARIAGQPVPASVRRCRSQLVDAMLDGQFHFAGRRIAVAGDPDLLQALVPFLAGMGAQVVTAVASTAHSPRLSQLPVSRVLVGDLDDFEQAAAAAGAELLLTHAHGRQAAERLGLPLLRVGFPVFDRIGVQHRCLLGYRGTRELIYEIANTFIATRRPPRPEDFRSAIAPADPFPQKEPANAAPASCR